MLGFQGYILATKNRAAIRKGITCVIEIIRNTPYKHNRLSYVSRDRVGIVSSGLFIIFLLKALFERTELLSFT